LTGEASVIGIPEEPAKGVVVEQADGTHNINGNGYLLALEENELIIPHFNFPIAGVFFWGETEDHQLLFPKEGIDYWLEPVSEQ